ncbi:MAG: Rrf2 family transcriptional regulator [Bacteroidetes bacterium]|nr:Rrf2 family transcriptional regulator [Bacteroidota bacterium]
MLSVTCKAAIKAVIYLGSMFKSGEKFGIREIADQIDENEHTVGKLLQKLAKAGLICSAKGPNGGFYIIENQMKLPILAIVEAIDGTDVFNQCGLGLHKCSAAHPCPIHNDFKSVREGFRMLCSEKTIEDLCLPVNSGIAYLIS